MTYRQIVKNTFKKFIVFLLRIESKLILLKYKPKIVAITGSVGKTSTKDAIYAVLSGFDYVRKSEKSFNSEIGLPLTILGCPNGWNNPIIWIKNIFKGAKLLIFTAQYPKWLILEVGIGKPGDMKKTASWLQSDVVIITAIGDTPSHIEFFNSRKHLIEEKARLIKTLKKEGILILNADDQAVLEMKEKTRNKIITYGFRKEADVKGSEENIFYNEQNYPKGIIFRVDQEGKSLPVIIEGVFGKNHIYASLGALAFATVLKLNILEAIDRLKNYDVPAGRMHLLSGIRNSLIVDDTYNSSPFACESGLKTIKEVKTIGRKIAVLGDMLQLGKHTKEAHEKIGRIVKDKIDILIVVGQRALFMKDGALAEGMNGQNIFSFVDSKETSKFLKDFIKENDLIFIKGSQGMRMEHIVAEIMTDQANKEKLLVRQDSEWLAKK